MATPADRERVYAALTTANAVTVRGFADCIKAWSVLIGESARVLRACVAEPACYKNESATKEVLDLSDELTAFSIELNASAAKIYTANSKMYFDPMAMPPYDDIRFEVPSSHPLVLRFALEAKAYADKMAPISDKMRDVVWKLSSDFDEGANLVNYICWLSNVLAQFKLKDHSPMSYESSTE